MNKTDKNQSKQNLRADSLQGTQGRAEGDMK